MCSGETVGDGMNLRAQPPMASTTAESLGAAGFSVAPDPAFILSAEGSIVAANDAAEGLFGQGLALLSRGRFKDALPAGSPLIGLIGRAASEDAQVREH